MRRETDLPDPVDARPVRAPAIWRWVISLVLAIGLAIAAFMVQIPIFFTYLPGPVESVEPLVKIQGSPTYTSEGDLLLTTVSVDTTVTFAEVVHAAFDRSASVVMRENVTQGASFEELEERQRLAMQESKRSAEVVALGALGLAHPRSDGVRVEAALQGHPAEDVFEEGDVIEAVDGDHVRTTCDVGDIIDDHEPGDEIRFRIRRARRLREVSVRTGRNPNDPASAFVGIQMSNINYRFHPRMRIDIDTGKIAGPSGGLMMTLAIYDRLTPGDLTRGRRIAGTGEIAACGTVTSIGGVEQKVAGAEREGADIFLAPAGNFAAAQRAARSVEVIAVASFDEVVERLSAQGG